MSLLKQIFSCYWHLSLLRGSPENTPYSKFLLFVSGLALSIVVLVQWRFSDVNFSEDLLNTYMTSVFLIFSYLGYSIIILYLRGLSHRSIQTATCLYFAHLVVHICASPLLLIPTYFVHANFKHPLNLLLGIIYLFLTLGLSVWQFIITAYIYRYALEITATESVIAAFGLFAVNVLTVSFWR